jgi:RNA polymerase primary sigma factor
MKPFVKPWTANSVDLYMSEIGRYPLLGAQEEIELAVQYERGRAAKRQLQSGALDALRRADLKVLVARGQRARRRLIESNLRLVIHLVRQYSGCDLPFADLVQEGNLGLMEAVERFDHRRGVRFATYAGWWIRQTVLRAIACHGKPIRLPPAVNDELVRLQKANAQLETRLRRSPTLDELAVEMGVPAQRVRQLQNWDRKIVSLDMPIGENDESRLADLVPDRDTPPLDEVLSRRQLRERLCDVMVTHLEPRDQTLLRLRFGLDGEQGQTLREVAHVLGITQERARQVEKRALKRLRSARVLYELGSF